MLQGERKVGRASGEASVEEVRDILAERWMEAVAQLKRADVDLDVATAGSHVSGKGTQRSARV
jgi:hypothetical protein